VHTLPGGGKLTYLDRSAWGGGPVKSGHAADRDRFDRLVLHYTPVLGKTFDLPATSQDEAAADLATWMRDRLQPARPDLSRDPNNPEVPYSFVIARGGDDRSAVVAEGRGLGRTGAHTPGHNSSAYGVAFAVSPQAKVTDGMVEALRWVGSTMLTVPASPTLVHSDVYATACPGGNVKARLGEMQPPFLHGVADMLTPDQPVRDGLIRAGDTGEAVSAHIRRLNMLLELQGNQSRVGQSYTFHDMAVTVTKNFQKWAELEVDGIVGPLTEEALARALTLATIQAAQKHYGFKPVPRHPGDWDAAIDTGWHLE